MNNETKLHIQWILNALIVFILNGTLLQTFLLENGLDEPLLPEYAQPALADYICYRHLSSGNLAKQSRAEFFRQSFYQQMRTINPQGAGSVTRMQNLYAVTDARYGR